MQIGKNYFIWSRARGVAAEFSLRADAPRMESSFGGKAMFGGTYIISSLGRIPFILADIVSKIFETPNAVVSGLAISFKDYLPNSI